ncbi:NYN domain-containing protein [Alkalinema pantanalense CENA528]|uniref:NYN domain-containing protein n=1 Tax=Alkalinema pantanalense TaxID=1620705 RepID=UPI003D6E4F9F
MARIKLVYVFLDVENIPSHPYAFRIRRFSRRFGKVHPDRLRAYAVNWRIREEAQKMLQKASFLTKNVAPGENAVDNRIIRDCTTFSQQGRPQDVYILVSGDGDYVEMVEMLHDRDKYVVCLTSKAHAASKRLLQCVDEHYFLEDLYSSN